MTLKYYTSSEVKGHLEIKYLCNIYALINDVMYTKLTYKNRKYYVVTDIIDKEEQNKEFLKQFEIKRTVRSILANIKEIPIEFQEYDGENGVFDNENFEVTTNNHTIRFALYINDGSQIENIRVFSDTEWLEIQQPELEKIKRKLFKQINY